MRDFAYGPIGCLRSDLLILGAGEEVVMKIKFTHLKRKMLIAGLLGVAVIASGVGSAAIAEEASAAKSSSVPPDAKTAASAAAKIGASTAARTAIGGTVGGALGALSAGATVLLTPSKIGCGPGEQCAK
jgi:hypothetical protein